MDLVRLLKNHSIIGDIDMNDEVEELEVIVKKIRYKDIVWVPESDAKSNSSVRPPGKQNYFQKWVMNKPVGAVFSLNEFYKEYPSHKTEKRRMKRLDIIISDMIKDNIIGQWNKKDEFRRLK